MPDSTQLTKTGGLQFHIAAAACYLPIMYIHLIASLAFAAMEPKEHRFVRFHALQSLLVSAAWIGGSMLMLALMMIVPFAFIFADVFVAAILPDLAGILSLLGLLGQLLFGMLAIGAALAGPVVLFGMTILCATQANPRIPLLASLADRFVGPPPEEAFL